MVMAQRLDGSSWLTMGEAQAMADMAAAGLVDLSTLEDAALPLEKVNEAISGTATRDGGFTNFVVNP